MEFPALTQDELNPLYNWVDEIPLSRPQKNISRDFSDGVLMAEIVDYFLPKYIEQHNYSAANSITKQTYNWETLNTKVFKKLRFQLRKEDIRDIVEAVPEKVQRVLFILKERIEEELHQNPKDYPLQDISQGSINRIPNTYSPNSMTGYHNMHKKMEFEEPAPTDVNQIIRDKDMKLEQLRQTIEILQMKMNKYEDLLKLKDNQINSLTMKLQQHGLL